MKTLIYKQRGALPEPDLDGTGAMIQTPHPLWKRTRDGDEWHGYWRGPMTCGPCQLTITAVVRIANFTEAVGVWNNPPKPPPSLEGELCNSCGAPTLKHTHT